MQINTLYFFSNYNLQDPSVRYRGYYVSEHLRHHFKIKSSLVYPSYKLIDILKFISVYTSALLFSKKDSFIIFQKIHTDGLYSKALKFLLRTRKKISIYDTDDADFLRYSPETINHFIKNCRVVTVGSKFLQEYAQSFNTVAVELTTPIIEHNFIKQIRNPQIHIGWIGDYGNNLGTVPPYSHKNSLEKIIIPVLLELDFHLTFTLLGIKNPADRDEIRQIFRGRDNVRLIIPEDIDWLNESDIYSRIAEFDIGLSPLVLHPFNEAKSAFKVKQYLSCGVPVLASPVGENANFVRDGINGYLCHSVSDFKKRMIEFNNMNNEEYFRFSLHAFSSRTDFEMASFCARLIDHLQNLNQ